MSANDPKRTLVGEYPSRGQKSERRFDVERLGEFRGKRTTCERRGRPRGDEKERTE